MPYIVRERRIGLHALPLATNAGELNYLISMLFIRYWENSQKNYQAINDIVGAVEGAKAEFQRQVVNKYEDEKIAQNGGLY